jgi:hypothetical protein
MNDWRVSGEAAQIGTKYGVVICLNQPQQKTSGIQLYGLRKLKNMGVQKFEPCINDLRFNK